MAWEIGNGKQLRVGIDPFVGDNDNYRLPEGIINHLEVLNLTTLKKKDLIGQFWKKDMGSVQKIWVLQAFG